jgi:hypothetical protein
MNRNKKIQLDFMTLILAISPLLLMNTVFSQRFIVFIAPLFAYLIFIYLIDSRNTVAKISIVMGLLATNMSYANLLVINSLVSYVHIGEYSGSILITNILDVLKNYEK